MSCKRAHDHERSTVNDPDARRRDFIGHALTFALVIGGLAILNLATSPHYPWFIWPMFGWGIGLAKHGLALIRTERSVARGPLASTESPISPTVPETGREWPDLEA